jgi:rhodanese-related sulfurtransferase
MLLITTAMFITEAKISVLSEENLMKSNGYLRLDLSINPTIGKGYSNITVEQAYNFLTNTSNGVQIPIDVRYDSEWAVAHIDTPSPENPKHHCLCAWSNETVLQEFMELYQGKEIILYCLGGSRSTTAANTLVEHNFDGYIYNMIGGINAWIAAGYPTIPNTPPNIPGISGDAKGKPGEEYQYTLNTIDIDQDDVSYYVNWSDNTSNQLVGPDHSGEEATLTHIWSEKGTYILKVKARDKYGAESDYATLEIKMPKTGNTVFHQLLLRIFEKIHVSINSFSHRTNRL